MALRGDSLFVADIDSVRIFHRESGAPLGAWGVEGATLLNDLAAGPDGTIYVTDTGFRAGAAGALDPSGTDAVYRFGRTGEPEAIATGAVLQNPNGVAVSPEGLVVVPFGGNGVFLIDAAGEQSVLANTPLGQLDGVVRLEDGTLYVTGWEGFSVYRVAPDGTVSDAFEGIDAPADLEYDATRGRLLIPTFNQNTIEVREVR
jgi:streptogramin lyase